MAASVRTARGARTRTERSHATDQGAPSIGDYALIGDCRTAALVSSAGSVDWWCLPRFDSGSAFGRLLDADNGGYCALAPTEGAPSTGRCYRAATLVLETAFRGPDGSGRVIDFMVMPEDPNVAGRPRMVRIVEGIQGEIEFALRVAPRFDYGEVRPWMTRHDDHTYASIGGDDALIVWCETELIETAAHELGATMAVTAGERARVLLTYCRPESVRQELGNLTAADLDAELERTESWWRDWSTTVTADDPDEPGIRRSAIVLKALTYAPTGAIVAAPTTSLPEVSGGDRNWDYRYAWVRDSSFSSRSFADIGCDAESDAFRAFIMRSAAGHAEDLQVLYGVGGERRVGPQPNLRLSGYRGSAPVRLGNAAARQIQLDAYGELVNLSWRWHRRGHSPDDDDWRFLVSLIDEAARRWSEPDCGIWEWSGEPQHFVQSKVLCWSAVDRGLRLAEECMRKAPTRRWRGVRNEIRDAIEQHGVDRERGIFVQTFDGADLDAALLLLPTVEFVDWREDRMVRTVAAIRSELDAGDGLLYRYRCDDGLQGEEGAFLPCSFWLVECLARGGELDDARAIFHRVSALANDLGLFSEEVEPAGGELLGNYPQGLTHLAHIQAAIALSDTADRR